MASTMLDETRDNADKTASPAATAAAFHRSRPGTDSLDKPTAINVPATA